MTVHRLKPLPVAQIRGRFVLADDLLDVSRSALAVGHGELPTEGIAYWAGRERDGTSYLLTAIVPRARREPQRVVADEDAIGEAARTARWLQLGILAQVHSHPGRDVRHSDGDDEMVLMPFEGMLSIVLPEYAGQPVDLSTIGMHQFQDGRWVWLSRESVIDAVRIAPRLIDLR